MLEVEEITMRKNIEKLIKNIEPSKHYFVVFGSNEPAERMVDILLKNQIKVEALIDNNAKKHGFEYRGVKVYSPENILKEFKENAVILIASKYYNEMLIQLRGMGYKENIHIFQTVKIGNDIKFSLEQEVFDERAEYIKSGMKVFEEIKKKYKKETMVFMCPYKGLGDVYMVGMFLKEYCKKNKISDYIITVTSNACKNVIELFGISDIEILKQEDSDCMMQFAIFVGLKECKVKILHQRFPYTSGIGVLGNHKGTTFEDHYRYSIFEMEKETVAQKPVKSKNVIQKLEMQESGIRKLETQEFETQKSEIRRSNRTIDDIEIDKFFEENNLVQGKTVILSPYANTATKLEDKFWEDIACEYKSKGYTVCTNGIGDREPAIKGTKQVFFQIENAIEIVEKAGTFIALRSGLCDVVATAKAKKIIYYPDRVYQEGSFRDFYSLKWADESDRLEEIVV